MFEGVVNNASIFFDDIPFILIPFTLERHTFISQTIFSSQLGVLGVCTALVYVLHCNTTVFFHILSFQQRFNHQGLNLQKVCTF